MPPEPPEQDDADDDVTAVDQPDTDADPEGSDKLGDAGKKALDAMKAQRNEARMARKALETELAALKAPKPDTEKVDAEAIREVARAEARAESLKESALDKVEAKAAKLFADPEDARALLAAHVDDYIDGNKVDIDAINEALTDLLSKKPHLAAARAEKRFAGSADGGARNGSKPDQLTRADLTKMSSQEIVKAQKDGRLADLLGG